MVRENFYQFELAKKEIAVPKIAAFDLDLTLHDIIAVYQDAFNNALIFMGRRPWNNEDFYEFHQNGFISNQEAFAILFAEKAQTAKKIFYDHYYQRNISYETIIPGASFMLYRLKYVFGLKVIGVTNQEQHMAKKALRDLGIFNLFDSITGPKGNRKLKPEIELLLIGLNKIAKKPDKSVWFAGDSDTDTICAKDANCTGIRYYHGANKPEDKNADAFYNCHFQFEKKVGMLLSIYPKKKFNVLTEEVN